MAVPVLVSVLKCVAVVLVVGAVPAPSQGKRTDSSGKNLKNVIITSFGEMPYEPMESGGYYQSDIIPVNFNDEIQQQTMDVALRTGILVEDPNEKKSADDDNTNDEIEESSLEDETTSTNAKRQASNDNSSEEKKISEKKEDDFLTPRVRLGYRKSKGHEEPRDTSNTFLSHPLNFGYEIPLRRQGKTPYSPYPPPKSSDGDNINREYYADLGEGWNLQDAKKILKGRNYNILVVTPNHYPYSYPGPYSRETPPPIFVSGARHPLFYSVPNFEYNPGFGTHRGGASYYSTVGPEGQRRQGEERGNSNKQETLPSLIQPSPYHFRGGAVPYTQTGYFNEDYLHGI